MISISLRTLKNADYRAFSVNVCFGGWKSEDLPKSIDEIVPYTRNRMTMLPEWMKNTIEILTETSSPILENVTSCTCKFRPVFMHTDPGHIAATCTWVHYEQNRELPSNFMAVGDSIFKVSPVKG